MKPTRYHLEIPCRAPMLNQNHRRHWAPANADFQAWKMATVAVARGLPRMQRIHVECRISFPDNRRRDVHNLYPTAKACVDGLVAAGVIEDDDDAHLVGPDMRRGPKAPNSAPWLVLIITELEAL